MIALARFFKNTSPSKVFLGSLASAVIFYLITNTLSWAFDPLYASKSFTTWFQALTVGLPQFAVPTWVFFRNALLAQGLFSALYLIATQTAPLVWKDRSAPAVSWPRLNRSKPRSSVWRPHEITLLLPRPHWQLLWAIFQRASKPPRRWTQPLEHLDGDPTQVSRNPRLP